MTGCQNRLSKFLKKNTPLKNVNQIPCVQKQDINRACYLTLLLCVVLQYFCATFDAIKIFIDKFFVRLWNFEKRRIFFLMPLSIWFFYRLLSIHVHRLHFRVIFLVNIIQEHELQFIWTLDFLFCVLN